VNKKKAGKVLVTGAAGFIGHHLVNYLAERGCWVRGVDLREPPFGAAVCNQGLWDCDLRLLENALIATEGVDEVYALAADMGGMGFIGSGEHDVDIMRNNALININTLEAARMNGVRRFLFTSSACVYPEHLQLATDSAPLAEADALPAWPDTPYGWEKLFTELLCAEYAKSTEMEVRIARFHNIYGPEGSWNDGREKLPAAACRKVAEAVRDKTGQVEVWGDGKATRSFCFIDDCLEMFFRLMHSDYGEPLNIGTDRAVSVDEMFDIVARIAQVPVDKVHIPGPQGVRGRNADLSKMRAVLDYEPVVSLEEGMGITYDWIVEKVFDDV
jgi:nucleoside-diphosphate-sugar epimerase